MKKSTGNEQKKKQRISNALDFYLLDFHFYYVGFDGGEFMNKTQEALKLALECIEAWDRGGNASDYWRDRFDAITAIREALAEQQTQQEPVAWIVEFDDGHIETTTRPVSDWKRGMWESAGKRFTVKPLYTSTPASKPWVGLTLGEAVEIWTKTEQLDTAIKLIEAKLREKNA